MSNKKNSYGIYITLEKDIEHPESAEKKVDVLVKYKGVEKELTQKEFFDLLGF